MFNSLVAVSDVPCAQLWEDAAIRHHPPNQLLSVLWGLQVDTFWEDTELASSTARGSVSTEHSGKVTCQDMVYSLVKICLCPTTDHLSGTWAPCLLPEYSWVWLNKSCVKKLIFFSALEVYRTPIQVIDSSNLIDMITFRFQRSFVIMLWKAMVEAK